MSTEINVTVPYGGGSLASDQRSAFQASDWCLIGGNDGRLGVNVRYQINPNFVVVDVWELDADFKSAENKTVVKKQILQSSGEYMSNATPLATCRLNSTTFAVKQCGRYNGATRIITVDPVTYEVTLEKEQRNQYSGNAEYNNGVGALSSVHYLHNLFMYPLEENKYLTLDVYHQTPYYRFNEMVWDPSTKQFGLNMVCTSQTSASVPLGTQSAQYAVDNGGTAYDFGLSVAYLHQGDGKWYGENSDYNGYLSADGSKQGANSNAYHTSQWVQAKKDRVGRIHFTVTASNNSGRFYQINNQMNKYWTLVYIPEAIRESNENPWTVCGGNTNFMSALSSLSVYYTENRLGFAAWLPLKTRPLSDTRSGATDEIYCIGNLLVGKNGFKILEEGSTSIPYGSNSVDNGNISEQRIIQSEWLDEDHFIVFYTNKPQYVSYNYTGDNMNHSQNGNTRYKVVHLIDKYIANVVATGTINSKHFFGRPSEWMVPFKFSDSRNTITSEAYNHLVSIWVPNFSPTVSNDTYTIPEDSVLTVSDLHLSVLANDSDLDGDSLTVSTSLVVNPTFGSVSMNSDGTFTYTPNANFTGTDSFSYRVLDGLGGYTDGIVYVTVTPVADGPTAVSDVYAVAEDQTLTFSDINLGVLANDFDVDGDSLTIDTTPVNTPQNGSLTLNSDGTFHYTPNANFTGTDSFEYKVEDGTGNAGSGTVTINVTSVNDSPVAVSDSFTMNEDETLTSSVSLLVNDSDLDGDSLTVNTTPVADVVNGTLTLNTDGTFTYAPPANHYGSELFTYEVSDGNGGTAQASVTITIYALNDTPIPVSDSYSVDENSSIDVSLSLGLIANDTDLDGDTLTVDTTPVVDVSNGTLVLSSDGTFTYTPYANYWGSDSFTYRVTDGNGGVATTTVNITITEVPNQAPVVAGIDSTYTLTQGQDTVITATATDVDGDAVTWSFEEVMSGSGYVVVNARRDDTNGSNTGAVYVYDGNDLTATPTKLTAYDGSSGDYFGFAGSVIANGKLFVTSVGDENWTGSVYVYDLNDLSAQPTKLTAYDGAEFDQFAQSISANSSSLVIGSNKGGAYVYDLGDLSATPTNLTSGTIDDLFGREVYATEDKIYIAAPYSDELGSNTNTGSVYVYDANDLSAAPTKLTAFDGQNDDTFGMTVIEKNGALAIAAPQDDDTANAAGAIYVYNSNDLTATPIKLTAPESAFGFGVAGGNLGGGVNNSNAMDIVGNKLFASAIYRETESGLFSTGEVFAYDLNDLSAAPIAMKAPQSDIVTGFNYGASITSSGDTLYVGTSKGIVYAYDSNDLNAAPTKITGGVSGDEFGWDVYASSPGSSLNGTTVTQSDNVFTVTPAQQDATFQLTFTATDSEGNASSTTSDFDFTYVNQAPAVMGIEAVYTLTTGQDTVITAAATDPEGDSTTWSYEEVLANGVPSGLNGTTIAQNGDVFTITPGSADANFTLRLTATDSAGNETSTDADFSHTYVAPGPAEYLLAGTMWSEGTGVGSVKTFNTSGTLLQSVATPGNISYGYANFGRNVATNGVKMAVGAPAEQDGGVANHGEITILNIDGSNPISVIYEDGRDAHSGDEVGDALAMSDNYMYAGVSKAEQYGGSGSGIVAIYDHNGNLQSTKTAPNANAWNGANQFFGYQVGWTGSRMVASAPQATSESGSYWDCYFRVYEENGTFVEHVALPDSKGDRFGEKMDVTGPECTSNKVVLSCKDNNVYVYDLDAADIAGSQVAIPVGFIAWNVAINDSYVYVGDGSSDVVKVYDHSGTFQFDIVPTSDVLTALGETTGSMKFGANIEVTNHHLSIVTGSNGKIVIYDTQGNNPVPFDTLGGSYGAYWSGGMQFYQ